MAGMWKRWLARHVNALSFWTVLTLVALALVLAAHFVLPAAEQLQEPPLPSPTAPPR